MRPPERATCIFCEIIAGRAPGEIVWADGDFVAFLDLLPIAPGHTLLVPRSHTPAAFDLPPKLYAALFERARMLQHHIQHTFGSRRVALAIEGFGVDHAHVHLVPVNRAGDLDPCKQETASRDELHAHGERLRATITAATR
jgi:histidine triad (HIT) family protein